LRVEDTGIGIPEEKRAKVFEAFSQVDSSISRRFGGTGLGLAICKQLTTLMSGDINFRPRPCGGTIFDVTIPAPPCRSPEPPKSSRDETTRVEALIRQRRPHVLVADDDAVNQKVVRAFLERLGVRVDCVNDGAEAVRAASTVRYDLVLMDCQMPTMDGFAATRQIRSLGGPTSTIPVVALTASAFDDAREQCLAAGMDRYLTKPIQRSALRETLHELLFRQAG
jgi:CheY-like chemotaxis protein